MDLLYPPFCVLCDKVLEHGSRETMCPDCQAAYPVLAGDLCVICSKPLLDKNHERCLDCRKRVHFFEEGKALWLYENRVRDAVKAYKYSDRREMGLLFARVLARYYNEHNMWQVDSVIPVPLHRRRLRDRGFSQTELIATHFCQEVGLELLTDGLTRKLDTVAQEGLSDKDRMANVRHAFEADPAVVKNRAILLIDDVYTTGATLDGCAKALADAEAGNIYFMTLAIGRGY